LAEKLLDVRHEPTGICNCTHCANIRFAESCSNPHKCYLKAMELLDCLPHKWDPRAPHPEDDDEMLEGSDGEPVSFDSKSMICRGGLKDAFRIFTEGVHSNDPPFY
ncbi:hypothetical protein C8J56DRAFT_723760, partial [Mycena floridula]